jgi:predicted MFS family arabinose efflux permease
MVGGRALGFIVLSLVFGTLVQAQGYRIVFVIIAVSMLLPLWWVLRVKEPAQRQPKQSFDWSAFRVLRQRRFIIFGLYAIFYSVVSFGVDGLITLFMSNEFNAAESAIGQYGALRGLGAVIGAVGGGLLVDRLGRRNSAIGGLIAVSIGAVLIGLAPGIAALLILGVVWGIAWGFQETIFVALAMDLSDRRIAASMFAIMMALSNVGTAVGEGVATGLTDNLPFATVFWLLAGLNIINFPILIWLFKAQPES